MLGRRTLAAVAVMQSVAEPRWSGWTPASLGGALAAWWNADDLAAASVTAWSDRVAAIMAIAAGSAIPAWANNSWAPSGTGLAKAGVTFDGVANCLIATSFAALPTGSTAGEIWALVDQQRPTATTGANVIAEYGTTAAAGARAIQRSTSASISRAVAQDGTSSTLDQARVFEGTHVLGAAWQGTALAGRLDGAPLSPGASTIASLNTINVRLRLGANVATSAGLFFQGVIRHVLVTTLLTAQQRLQLEAWLAWDGGIAFRLPPTHPYRNGPP